MKNINYEDAKTLNDYKYFFDHIMSFEFNLDSYIFGINNDKNSDDCDIVIFLNDIEMYEVYEIKFKKSCDVYYSNYKSGCPSADEIYNYNEILKVIIKIVKDFKLSNSCFIDDFLDEIKKNKQPHKFNLIK